MQPLVTEVQCPSCGEYAQPDDGQPASFCLQCRFPLMAIAGKYRLQKAFAHGGAGTLYLAHHIHLLDANERVIKVLETNQIDDTLTARFFREVQITARASQANEHIVRIYDDFGHEPFLGYYYVMEYLEGVDLGTRIKPKGLPLDEAVEIFLQLCDAMIAAHQTGVIHRDLKPENILLTEKGTERNFVKVIDFGIAKRIHSTHLTSPAQGITGTPMYMSPEQCLNQMIDYRADIYAMGLIFYEMLTGAPPFSSTAGTTDQTLLSLIYNHIHTPPTPIAQKHKDLSLPVGLDEAIIKALAKAPDDRFQSVELMKQAIEHAMFDQAHLLLQTFEDATSLGQPTEPAGHSPFGAEEPPSASGGSVGGVIGKRVVGHSSEEHQQIFDPSIFHETDTDELTVITSRPPAPLHDKTVATGAFVAPEAFAPTQEAELLTLIEKAEALRAVLHLAHGASARRELEALTPILWQWLEQVEQEPATHLRGLLALSPVMSSQGELHPFTERLRKQLKQPALLPMTLRLQALQVLGSCYKQAGQLDEGSAVLQDALAMSLHHADSEQRGPILNHLGRIYRLQGKHEEAQQSHREALLASQSTHDPQTSADAHAHLGNIYRLKGDLLLAEEHLRKALILSKEHEDRSGEGSALGQLGNLYRTMGRQEEAKQAFEEALLVNKAQEEPRGEGITRNNLGHLLMQTGNLNEAASQYEAALQIFHQIEDRRGEAITLGYIGDLSRRQGEYEKGMQFLAQSLAIQEQMGTPRGQAICLNQMGALYRDQGSFAKAAECHEQAATLQAEINDRRGLGLTKLNQSLLMLEQDELGSADEHLAAATALLEQGQGELGELHLYKGILYQLAGGQAAAIQSYKQALMLADQLGARHLEARTLCFFGALESRGPNIDKAKAAIQKAHTMFTGTHNHYGLRLVDLCRGQLLLRWAREAEKRGAPQEQKEHREAAEAIATSQPSEANTDSRLALRLLRRALSR